LDDITDWCGENNIQTLFHAALDRKFWSEIISEIIEIVHWTPTGFVHTYMDMHACMHVCFTRYSGNICAVRWKIVPPDNFYDR